MYTFYQMKFQARSGKRVVKVSKCGETYIDFYKLYEEYDPFLTSGGAESNSAWVTEVIIFISSVRNSRSGNLRPSVCHGDSLSKALNLHLSISGLS